MIEIFHKGGPIMWPLLITSVISLAVILERVMFFVKCKLNRNIRTVAEIIELAIKQSFSAILEQHGNTKDYVAKVLLAGIRNNEEMLELSMQQAANRELSLFNRGLSILDTAITLSPLLGLLGTVVGMINAFRLIGESELGAPTAITGGIAEALIATAFGLTIAIICLVPYNFFISNLESARHEIEDAASQLELALKKKA